MAHKRLGGNEIPKPSVVSASDKLDMARAAYAQLWMAAVNRKAPGIEGRISDISPDDCELLFPDGTKSRIDWDEIYLAAVRPHHNVDFTT
jgi:hypothetical protein